jgi:hypothetical protein
MTPSPTDNARYGMRRRRGNAINHSNQITAGVWNAKTHNQLRVII